MKDANGKILNIGDKIHVIGRGNEVLYVIEIGKDSVGVNSDKGADNCYGVYSNRLVKFKKQD